MKRYAADPISPEESERRNRLAMRYEAEQRRQSQAAAQYRLASVVGRRYAECTFENYDAASDAQRKAVAELSDYVTNLVANVQAGRSVILYGPVGTGKDHLMAAMLREALEFSSQVLWVNGMDLFGDFRDAIDNGSSERQGVSRLTSPTVLALSDPAPPRGNLTDFQVTMLFRVIDRRYRDMLPTWITVNASNRQQAEERLGSQVVDRLGHGALAIHCEWESYRKS